MQLDLEILNPVVTCLEGVRIRLTLTNDGPRTLRIPGPYDQTAALALDVYGDGEDRLWTMSGLSHQAMMTTARIDHTPDLDTLAPDQQWVWDLDIASYHYALPVGEFALQARYEYPPETIQVRSPRARVRVAAVHLTDVAVLCDNPVIEGVTLLLTAARGGASRAFLRQHNAQRPLAAWYSHLLPDADDTAEVGARSGPDPRGAAFLAAARFFTMDSFEPAFEKWLIRCDQGVIRCHRFREGRQAAGVRTARLPPGRRLLPSACYDADERLILFLQRDDGVLEAWELSEAGLQVLFEHRAPAGAGAPVAIRADCNFIHVITPWRGILYDRLTLSGMHQDRVQAFASRMQPYSLEIDPFRRVVKAVFRDSPRGRGLELVVAGPEPSRSERLTVENLPVRGALRELSFDRDGNGTFHLLASTSKGNLYYFRDGQGPSLLASGEERFFPHVLASSRLYLGHYRRRTGYRFAQWPQSGRGPKGGRLGDVS